MKQVTERDDLQFVDDVKAAEILDAAVQTLRNWRWRGQGTRLSQVRPHGSLRNGRASSVCPQLSAHLDQRTGDHLMARNAGSRAADPAAAASALGQEIAAENSSAIVNGQGRLRQIIEAAAREARLPLSDLTVLDKKVDPYRQDTPAGHRDGAWLAEQMARLGITKPIHLRGLHYALVSSTSLTKPDGSRYLNDPDSWAWLQVEASKAARWLGYVRHDQIIDERNSAPVIIVTGNGAPEIEIGLGATIEVKVPDLNDIVPTVYLSNFKARQKYRLVVYGEKTSLADVVAPLCRSYKADLYLPSGEITDSQLYLMAKTGAEDGRPMIVFIIADFDPAGHQMAVSIGRKLMAFRDLLFPRLSFEVIPIALTEDQVRDLDLPSTPLKETERRADRWREEHGRLEQTEVDALATLRPEVLRRIVVEAFDRYFDHTLDRRAEEVRDRWEEEAQAIVDQELDNALLARLHAEAESQLGTIRAEIDRINEQLRASTDVLDDFDVLPPIPEPPEPELSEGGLPPLISSTWEWVGQTKALIARKCYGNGAGE